MKRAIAILLIAISLFTAGASARTWLVNADGTGDAPTIQAAVDSAAGGDIVLLANGTYRGTGNRDVVVHKSITIRSDGGNPEHCIIDCQGSAAQNHRGFQCDAQNVLIEGITIKSGYHERAGAVDMATNYEGLIALSRCHLINNHAIYGGALGCLLLGWENYDVTDCLFSGNSAVDYGGALFLEWHLNPDSDFKVCNCTFVGNSSYYGSVIAEWFYEPPLNSSLGEGEGTHFRNCTLVYNSGPCLAFGTLMKAEQTIIAYNGWVTPFLNSRPWLACVNVYGNEGGDWIGHISDQYGIRGNFSGCPSFCSVPAGDLHLCDESPCLPGNHPDAYDCGLIGAWDMGCFCGVSRTEPTAWGTIKAMYR